MKARPYQSACLQALLNFFNAHHDPSDNPVVAMPTGCHALGHGILMHDGTVRAVEDVLPGDRLMGPDSAPRTVLRLARGRQEMRRVVPTKGEPFVVNLDHKLSVKVVAQCKVGKYPSEREKVETITVRQHESGTDWYRHIRKLRRTGVEFPTAEQPLDPRFVGLMLGDGSLANGTVLFSGTEPEIIRYLIASAAKDGCYVRPMGQRSFQIGDPTAGRAGPNRIMHKFRQLGLDRSRSSTVFIPQVYKVANRRQRLELLAGLIDSDGHLMHTGGFEIVTISQQLARDLLFLCRSLGFAAYSAQGVARLNGKDCGPKWRVTISGEGLEQIEPLLAYKKATCRRQIKDVLCTGFTTQALPEDDYYGFTLDGDNLYLDESFTVHHNTGKAFCIADFMQYVMKTWPGQRIINLVHVKELVQQNAATLKRVWPQAPVGVFSAGLGERTAHMPITFAGTKSVASNLNAFGRQDIVIVDECHLIPEKEESEYRKVLAYFKALNPHVRVVGFSATPFRMGLGLITDGSIFSHVAYDITGLVPFNDLLDEGYLCPLIPIQTQMIIDVSGVKKVAGDFSAGELERTVNREHLTRAALTETVRAARERNHWLIFASGIEHTESVAAMLSDEFDVPCVVVHGKLTPAQRDEAVADFKSGKVRACVNANILTTGFDMPWLDCIVALRPTNSVVLHVQMLGRGTRPHYAPGFDLDDAEGRLGAIGASSKQNCLVLDFAGNVTRLGPINDPRVPKRKGPGDGTVPIKLCDECGCLNHISARVCDNCGTDFPIEEKITETASTAELIAKVDSPISERFEVKHVTYEQYRSKNPGKPVMLQAHYYCGVQRFSEVVCIEHYGQNVRNLAKHWWKERTGSDQLPGTVAEALQQANTIRAPKAIQVWVNRKAPGTRKLQPQVTKAYFE